MICNKCGNENINTNKFCGECGQKINIQIDNTEPKAYNINVKDSTQEDIISTNSKDLKEEFKADNLETENLERKRTNGTEYKQKDYASILKIAIKNKRFLLIGCCIIVFIFTSIYLLTSGNQKDYLYSRMISLANDSKWDDALETANQLSNYKNTGDYKNYILGCKSLKKQKYDDALNYFKKDKGILDTNDLIKFVEALKVYQNEKLTDLEKCTEINKALENINEDKCTHEFKKEIGEFKTKITNLNRCVTYYNEGAKYLEEGKYDAASDKFVFLAKDDISNYKNASILLRLSVLFNNYSQWKDIGKPESDMNYLKRKTIEDAYKLRNSECGKYNDKVKSIISELGNEFTKYVKWKDEEPQREKYEAELRIKIQEERKYLGNPPIGCTKQEALRYTKWSTPTDINKTTTKYGTHEQYCYSNFRYLYFDNDILTAIQD